MSELSSRFERLPENPKYGQRDQKDARPPSPGTGAMLLGLILLIGSGIAVLLWMNSGGRTDSGPSSGGSGPSTPLGGGLPIPSEAAGLAGALAPTSLVLETSPNPSRPGEKITVTVTVRCPSSPARPATGDVAIYRNEVLIGKSPLLGGVASGIYTDQGAGSFTLKAHYEGDPLHAESWSEPVNHSIVQAPPAPPARNVTDFSTTPGEQRYADAAAPPPAKTVTDFSATALPTRDGLSRYAFDVRVSYDSPLAGIGPPQGAVELYDGDVLRVSSPLTKGRTRLEHTFSNEPHRITVRYKPSNPLVVESGVEQWINRAP